MLKGRIEYLDAIKGFSILLVVFCHYVLLPSDSYIANILMCLAWGAVPCFMIVSGGLMHNKKEFVWIKHLKKIFKVYSVLVGWKLIYFVIYLKVKYISVSKVSFLKYLFLFGNLGNIPSDVTWYMEALLTVLLIFPISYTLYNNKSKVVFYFLLGITFLDSFFISFFNELFAMLSKTFSINLLDISGLKGILPISSHSNMIFFFLLGALLFEKREYLKSKLNSYKFGIVIPFALIVTGILGLIITKYITASTFKWEGIYLTYGYYRLSTIVLALGIYFVFLISDFKINYFLSKYVGKYTMGIYYIHYIFLSICKIYIYPYLDGFQSIGLNIIKTLLTVCISIFITKVLLHIPVLKELVK